MRLGRLAVPIIAVTAIVLLAGATAAWAAARSPGAGVTTPSPALMALPTGPAPELVAEIIPNPKSGPDKSGVPDGRGVVFETDSRAAKETATFPGGGTAGVNPAVGTGSPAVTIEFVSPHTLVRVNSPIPVRATFSEPVSGFTVEDVIVGNGTADGFTGSDGDAVYAFNVTPNAIGVVTADIPADAAEDGDGNGNTAAAQLWLGIPYDDDRDDGISKYEAISAVRDYFDGQLTKEDTLAVIRLYFQPIVGADSEALELTTAMLDGSAPVPAAAFQWEQVNNGSPTVVLANADTSRASFTLPALSNNQDFIFRLTVTYAGGHTSQDAVTVTGRPTPGIIVGAVSGHTASLNGAAEFGVQLRSRPSAEVVIPLSSSDESEGIPEQTQVVFTPENWNREQVVVVRGQNADVQGGVQRYEIIVGNSQSSDRFYDGLETANVAMRGIALRITAPERIEPLISNLPARIEPRITYTGGNRLSFALTEAPSGMSIDFSYGTITWTPQESDEGWTFDVTIKVNDGALFSEASFQVTVILPEPLATEVQGNVLTVVDSTTTLDGLSVTLPPDASAPPTLEKTLPESVPDIPPWITPISDVLVVKSSLEDPVEIRFPIGQLPAGVSLDDVNLYAYIKVSDAGEASWFPVAMEHSFEGTEDSPVLLVSLGGLQGLAVLGYHRTSPAIPFEPGSSSNNQRVARSETSRTEPPRGCGKPTSPPCTEPPSISVEPPPADSVTCSSERDWFGLGGSNDNNITCTYSRDADVKVRIKNFGDINGCRWGFSREDEEGVEGEVHDREECENPAEGRAHAYVEDIAIWAITAQLGLAHLGLGYNKDITVKIEPMPTTEEGERVGYVCTFALRPWCFFENRSVIHISDNNTRPVDEVQGTLVHEYFHHAQGHSDTDYYPDQILLWKLLIDPTVPDQVFTGRRRPAAWLTEGTAVWFADELGTTYDSLNAYPKNASGAKILERGLNSRDGEDDEQNPYERFSFFKLLTRSCDNFNSQMRRVLGRGPDGDPTGLVNLNSLLDEASCDFGDHLGEARSGSLEAAISYYNYATQHKGKISLLDHNEPNNFSFIAPIPWPFDPPLNLGPISFTHDWLDHDAFGLLVDIPEAGAYSFIIPAISLDDDTLKLSMSGKYILPRIPEGKVAELVIETNSEMILSITSESDDFIGMNTIGPEGLDEDPHIWFHAQHRTTYIYPYTDEGTITCDTSGGMENCLPDLFVTLVNPSLSADVDVEVSFRIRDEGNVDLTVGPIITSHTDGDPVSDRVVTVRGSMPEEGREATKEVIVTANGIETRTALNLDGSFAADVVIGFGDNSIKAQGFDDQATPVTNETGITIEGISSSSTRANALIPSRVVFVLRWDTDRTDIDLHSTDGEGGHIYFGRRTVGPGNLDRDDVFGFGPEVISYRETDDNIYVNGTFDVDVHYFSGLRAGYPATNYTLDVILNESGVGDRRLRRFESITPLTRSDRRFNGILGIFCGSERVCGLDHYDNTKLSPTGISTLLQRASSAARSARSAGVQHGGPMPFPSAYEQCMSELETALAKSGSVDWSCNPDGTKQWP